MMVTKVLEVPTLNKRICNKCNKIVDNKHNCRDKTAEKIYNKVNRPFEEFYQSYAWRKKREQILKRDAGLCQECSRNGLTTYGNIVHHIIEVKEDYSLRLVDDNLEVICANCHNKEHGKDK